MAAPTEKGEYDIAGAARELLEKREPAGIVGIRESAAAVLAALVGTLHLDRDLLSGLVIVVLGAGARPASAGPATPVIVPVTVAKLARLLIEPESLTMNSSSGLPLPSPRQAQTMPWQLHQNHESTAIEGG
jgi:malic enzyme